MYKKVNIYLGLIFVVLGVIFLLNNIKILDLGEILDFGFIISMFWPLFIIIPALAMHSIYFSGKNSDAGILVPGGILLVTGITCQLSMLFGIWNILWPGFILSVAVGLFELYVFGARERGLLIPVFILGGLSLIFFFVFSFPIIFNAYIRQWVIPLILIILGAYILKKRRINS